MAYLNREEVSSAIQALAAVVGETEHKASLDDNFAESVVFRKDVSATDTAPAATKTLAFLDVDYLDVTQSANVTYTFSGIQQGELKYLKITKGAGETIAFANADDQSMDASIFDDETVVYYLLINKDSNILAIPLSQDVFKASTAEAQALTIDNKFITPSTLADVNAGRVTKLLSIPTWDMDNTDTKNVPHGLTATQYKTMIVLGTRIRSDDDAIHIPLDSASLSETDPIGGGVSIASTVQIVLSRFSQGMFNKAAYSSTSFSRGDVLISYIP